MFTLFSVINSCCQSRGINVWSTLWCENLQSWGHQFAAFEGWKAIEGGTWDRSPQLSTNGKLGKCDVCGESKILWRVNFTYTSQHCHCGWCVTEQPHLSEYQHHYLCFHANCTSSVQCLDWRCPVAPRSCLHQPHRLPAPFPPSNFPHVCRTHLHDPPHQFHDGRSS